MSAVGDVVPATSEVGGQDMEPKKKSSRLPGLAVVIAAPLLLAFALASIFGSLQPSSAAPSTYAQQLIPANMLALYQSPLVQNECPTLSWTIVAAIIHLESNDGRNTGVSSAGATGPSQFLPTTWDAQGRTVVAFTGKNGIPIPYGRVPDGQGYALDGDGDGIADINNTADSVPATARFLCANGGGNPSTLYQAILSYNHARWYVIGGVSDSGSKFIGVLPLAKKLAAAYNASFSTPTGPGGIAAGSNSQELAQAILLNRNIITDGRQVNYDLRQQAAGGLPSAGVPFHPDLLAVTWYIGQVFQVHISALESGGTGHATSSAHYGGWAVDISAINGVPTTGRDPNAFALLSYIMPVLPFGSGIGQSQCGITVPLSGNVTEFPDSCNHLHLQIP